jgi:hypothetical protein
LSPASRAAACGQDDDRATAKRKRDAYATKVAGLSDADRNTVRSLVASLHELGEIQREQNHADCVALYREALELAELLDLSAEAAIGYNLGGAYEDVPDVHDLDAAERWYRRSLDLCDERDRLGRSKCHSQLGSVAFARFQEARAAGRGESELVEHLLPRLARKLLHPCDEHMGVGDFSFPALAIQTASPSGRARRGRTLVSNNEVRRLSRRLDRGVFEATGTFSLPTWKFSLPTGRFSLPTGKLRLRPGISGFDGQIPAATARFWLPTWKLSLRWRNSCFDGQFLA